MLRRINRFIGPFWLSTQFLLHISLNLWVFTFIVHINMVLSIFNHSSHILIRLIFIIKMRILIILCSIHNITFLFLFIYLHLLIANAVPSKHCLAVYILLRNVLTIIWKPKWVITFILFIYFVGYCLDLCLSKTYRCRSPIYSCSYYIFILRILNIVLILLYFTCVSCNWLRNLLWNSCSISHLRSVWSYWSFLIP